MKQVYAHLALIVLLLTAFNAFSQCPPGQSRVTVLITPDNYPNETSWDLVVDGNTVLSGGANSDSICVPTGACVAFTIHDTYGDGMCCSYGQGGYQVKLNGQVVGYGGDFDYSEQTIMNCGPGSFCQTAIAISTGPTTAPHNNTFYSFVCPQTGVYEITTCGLTTCDTKLWVYGECNSQTTSQTNTGTLFYDDNNTTCGQQARIEGYMQAGTTYYVRVGFAPGSPCANSTLPFEINFLNEITGCMDQNACNYNPLATLPGQCYFYPDPLCPAGPDLELDQQAIINSLQLRTELATNCMVVEGCLNGYGERTVLAFDTHIRNIGAVDYYVGNPNSNPSQFTFQNCHGHAHYEGYADYVLYKPDGTPIPIGQKNGFCVMDLECSGGGNAQYGCGNMGISAGCGDIYGAYLDCQWIDITDVDTGSYVLAVKVNWDQSPDALGRYELSYENNWAQACIKLTKNQAGELGFEVSNDCPPVIDCNGTPYGNVVVDCNGDCGGSAIKGDVDLNGNVEDDDATVYLNGIVGNTMTPSECRDLSADNIISVWDAALALNCGLYGNINNNCEFPITVQNPNQHVTLGYTTLNSAEQYIDVYIKNPNNRVSGYEFTVGGITIGDVESLINPADYPMTPRFAVGGTKVVGLSLVDSTIPKNLNAAPLCRIYYSSVTDPQNICVNGIVHILNSQHQPVVTSFEYQCVSVLGVDEITKSEFSVYPNPATTSVTISLKEKTKVNTPLKITDMNGKTVYESIVSKGQSSAEIVVRNLSPGSYNIVCGGVSSTFVKQ